LPAVAPTFLKLHRPPPEIRIFRPGSGEWSMSSTRRPRWPARAAQSIPAAPAPMMIASKDRDIATDKSYAAGGIPGSGHASFLISGSQAREGADGFRYA
jgi:hypothetical protein